MQEPDAEQVAEVGDDPVGAGLDERVVVELAEIRGDQVGLLTEHPEEGLERPVLAGFGVALAVEPRQQLEQLVAQERHELRLRDGEAAGGENHELSRAHHAADDPRRRGGDVGERHGRR